MPERTKRSSRVDPAHHAGVVETDVAAVCAAANDSSPLPTAAVEDERHLLCYANAAFLDLVGVAGESALGRPFAESFPELSAGGTLALLDRAYRTGKAANAAQEVSAYPRRAASHGLWTAWPADRAGTHPAMTCLQRIDATEETPEDRHPNELSAALRQVNERLVITYMEELEQHLEERKVLLQEAKQGNRAKASFLATVSHELRTPLNAIVGYIDLLDAEISGHLNRSQREQLGRIGAGTRHLIEMVEEILLFSRLEAEREEVYVHRVDVTELAQEAAALVEPLAREQGLTFRVQVPDEAAPMLTDPGKARQILVNLLRNAVKFTDDGEVRLEAVQDGTDVLFVVRDTGMGIASSDLDRIFEAFHQAEQVTTRRKGGTGLGLPVSRQLARLLGGDVTVESSPGEGSMFTLRLPGLIQVP